MTLRTKLILAGLLGFACVLGLIFSFTNRGSVDSYIAKTFAPAAAGAVPGSTPTTRTFTSSDTPVKTADRIAKEWKPAERLNQPSGVFLRYQERIVAVTPAPNNGSFISVDDSRSGYNRWFPIVGGFWGSTGVGGGGVGGAGGFRGGGPGGGK